MTRVHLPSAHEGLRETYNDGGFSQELTIHPAIRAGRALWSEGQTAITSGGNIANQFIQTASLGALAAGASSTVVLNNTLVTATTVLMGAPIAEADPGAGVQLEWWISARVAGTSITLGVRNTGASAMGGAIDVTAVLVN